MIQGQEARTAYGQLSGEGWYHTSRTYNARGEMTRIKHRHSNQLVGGTQWNQERIAEVVYGLDPAGNPLRIDEYYDAAGNYHRSADGYDALGRLTGWAFGGDTKSWTYDWVGNWLTSSDGTFVTDPDVDWLDSSPVPSATYDYNKLGALEDMTVSANTDTFSYDDQDLLSQVSYGVGGSSTMVWDADQQRQKLTNSGGNTYFVYDPTAGVPAVLVETDGENETFYVREPGGELIARATGQTRQYYFFDRLGSTVAMVPAVEGNPTDRLFYTPWGEVMTSGSRASTVGTTANPYRYVGQLGYYYHHQDAGLQNWMQLGVRFYEPELGRFERRDPEEMQGLAAYSYADDGPTAAIDPTGRVCVPAGPCKFSAKGTEREIGTFRIRTPTPKEWPPMGDDPLPRNLLDWVTIPLGWVTLYEYFDHGSRAWTCHGYVCRPSCNALGLECQYSRWKEQRPCRLNYRRRLEVTWELPH